MRSIEATELGIFTTVAVLLALVMKFRKRQTIPDRPGLQHPPMIPSIPILGSLPFIPDYSGFHEFFAKKSETMGPVIGFYMAQEYAVVVSGKEAIFDALVRKTDMAGRPELFTKLKYFNRRFKGFAEHMYDEEFKKYHPLVVNILREFGFGKRIMETRIRQEVDIVVNNIRAYQGREFDPYEIITSGVFNVISSILFNKRYEFGDPELRRILELELLWFTEYYDFMIVDTFRALLKLPSYKRKLEENLTHKNELMHWIHRAVIDAAYNRNEGDSFVTCFLQRQESNSYDYEQLAFVVRDLILGGTDTSSTSVRYFIIMMANNPEVQDKLQQEIDAVIGFDREVTLDDERNLPYTRATILELMRRNTLVALALPHEAMKDTTILDYFIPEGTRVIVNLYSTHMDPKVWTDPEKFRPERFLDSSGNVVDKEKVIPFSMGKRSCTGEQLGRQEVFLHCASLAHHFRILPPEGQDIISVTDNVSLVTTPSPFKARLIPRDVKLQ